MPRASGLEDELKKEFGAEVELIPGSGGVFTVCANGKQIFSKHETRRFPKDGEIVDLLR
ncbi:MAG: SelT/SelW/SelH family protein [Candidatus Electrothrix sp. MAN1_4]|nr:SelT/SelW/SelH family protein [Candidatus Electrothrix sp. MAN1_4]